MNNKKNGDFLLINPSELKITLKKMYNQVIKLDVFSFFYCEGSNNNIKINSTSDFFDGLTPLAINLSKTSNGFIFSPSKHGVSAVYYIRNANGICAISSQPDVIAALFDCDLSKEALYQDLVMGFRIDNTSIFDNIYKLRVNEYLELENGRLTLKSKSPKPLSYSHATEQLFDILLGFVAKNFDDNYISELTGGIDSRLVYALGLAGGKAPRQNFTIGNDSDPDVQVAQLISQSSNSAHYLLNQDYNADSILKDGYNFAVMSGFSLNAASYSWMPNVYKQLEPYRKGQVTGVGGECAGDFYFTPFDKLISHPYIFDKWMKKRLYSSGNLLVNHVGGHEYQHEKLKSELAGLLNTNNAQAWRSSLVSLYAQHRVTNWVGPVLKASSNYYDVCAPLLTDPYLDWALSVPLDLRKNRQAQLSLVKKLHPKIAEVPYASQLGSNFIRNNKVTRIANKLYKRSLGIKSQDDLGSNSVIKVLIQDKSINHQVSEIMRKYLSMNENHILLILHNPDSYTKQLGFLVTACWAKQRINELKNKYIN